VHRTAAVLSCLTGLGFGLPGAYGAYHLAREGEVWTFLGFPTYGDGPFETWGIPTSTGLIAAFVGVCAAEEVVGMMLWRGRGTTASAVLLPVELFFWAGFALPAGFVLGPARVLVGLAGRRRVD